MTIRTLAAASTVALLAASGASLAQETVRDGLVAVDVAGSIVEVPVSLAAQACGMDAADIIAAADMVNTDAKGADMVAPEPGSEAADASAGMADPSATTEAAVGAGAGSTETAEGTVVEGTGDMPDPGLTPETATGEAQTAEMADPAAGTAADAGTDMAAADAGTGAAADAGTDMADAGTEATAADAGTDMAAAGADAAGSGTAATDDMMASAELTASGEAGVTAPTVVCQIDQATADQNGFPAAAN